MSPENNIIYETNNSVLFLQEKKKCYQYLPIYACKFKPREGILVMSCQCLRESRAGAACVHTMHHNGTCKTMLPHIFLKAQLDVSSTLKFRM